MLTLYCLSTNVRQGLSWSQIFSWDLTETLHPVSKEHRAGRRGPRHSAPTSGGFFLRDLEGHHLPLEKGCGSHGPSNNTRMVSDLEARWEDPTVRFPASWQAAQPQSPSPSAWRLCFKPELQPAHSWPRDTSRVLLECLDLRRLATLMGAAQGPSSHNINICMQTGSLPLHLLSPPFWPPCPHPSQAQHQLSNHTTLYPNSPLRGDPAIRVPQIT